MAALHKRGPEYLREMLCFSGRPRGILWRRIRRGHADFYTHVHKDGDIHIYTHCHIYAFTYGKPQRFADTAKSDFNFLNDIHAHLFTVPDQDSNPFIYTDKYNYIIFHVFIHADRNSIRFAYTHFVFNANIYKYHIHGDIYAFKDINIYAYGINDPDLPVLYANQHPDGDKVRNSD